MHLKTEHMRIITGVCLMLTSMVGIMAIFQHFNIPLHFAGGISIGAILYGIYTGLWYKDLSNMEQEYQKSIMHEDRIPVIGARPIDWDEYRDIPKLDINSPLTFDRNKIGYLYEPNKPLT